MFQNRQRVFTTYNAWHNSYTSTGFKSEMVLTLYMYNILVLTVIMILI
jgi:hypothetical protein